MASSSAAASSAAAIAPLPVESAQDALKRLRSLKGVTAVLLLDSRGACVHAAGPMFHSPNTTTGAAAGVEKEEQRYAALVQQITKKAGQLMALLEGDDDDDETDEGARLQLVRLRSVNHEVVISLAGGYCVAVVAEAGASAGVCGGE